MREVVVETIGKETRTIEIGREKQKRKRQSRMRTKEQYIAGLICSTRILIRSVNWDGAYYKDTKCWKTTKSGLSHARKNWQRHGERQPSVRRHRWGRKRNPMYPSVRVLNELGRCIYPCVDERDYLEYIMEEV